MHALRKGEALTFVRERLGLFDEAGLANPFACGAWVLHFIEHIADDDWTFVVPETRVDGQSLMLLYSRRESPRVCAAVTNYYASLYSPLIGSARDRRAAVRALVDQLDARRPRFAAITFAPIEDGSPDSLALREALSRHGWYVKRYFCFGNWYLPCAGLSFEEYMSGRDSRLYNTWVRKSKKFTMKKGTAEDARLEIVTDHADIETALTAYDSVYAKSWKEPEPYPTFVRDWARICARNGWLRLGLAWVGNVPIAAQFWFTMNRRAYIFKLAYDEEYSKWSAGTVLTAHMIQYSLERDQVVEIDYLTGDDAYKQSWMSARRERIGFIACNLRAPRGILLAGAEWAGEVRQRLRRVRGTRSDMS